MYRFLTHGNMSPLCIRFRNNRAPRNFHPGYSRCNNGRLYDRFSCDSSYQQFAGRLLHGITNTRSGSIHSALNFNSGASRSYS